MEKFRNLTKNIFFRIFLGIVGLSFITFGVGDFILNASNSWIAKVDGNKISYNNFVRILQSDREKVYRSNPSEQTLQYLNSNQFTLNALNRLVTDKLIDLTKEYYGIYPDKDLILKEISKYPSFLDQNGQFQRNAFINYLKRNNLSEDKFVDNVSRRLANQIILSALTSYKSKENPKLAKAIYKRLDESRKADIIEISLNNIPTVKKPSETELKEFFETKEGQFTKPEYRKISYIEFSEDDLVSKIKVTDDEIQDYYESSSLYIKPANKDFYHILFDDQKSANNFLNELEKEEKTAKNFLKIAKTVKNVSKEDVLFDNVVKSDLLPEVADAAFNLSENDHTMAVESPLGFHIFYLAQNNPESREKLTRKLKNEIKENLISEKKEEIFISKIEDISDDLLTTNSLKEVAKKFNFKVKTLDKIDESGLNKKQKNIAKKIDHLDNFIKNSFVLPENETSELFYAKSGNKHYALFVDILEEPYQQKLSEVTKPVTKLFLKEKKQENLSKLAFKIYGQLQEGKKLHEIISKNNVKVSYNRSFSRSDKSKNPEFLEDLFHVNINQATRPYPKGDKIKIAIVRKAISPKIEQKKLDELAKSLSQEFKSNLVENYDIYIQTQFPVEVNDKVLQRLSQEGV